MAANLAHAARRARLLGSLALGGGRAAGGRLGACDGEGDGRGGGRRWGGLEVHGGGFGLEQWLGHVDGGVGHGGREGGGDGGVCGVGT